jgi:hypothetical protein
VDGRRFLNWLEAQMREGGWLSTFPTVRAVRRLEQASSAHHLRAKQFVKCPWPRNPVDGFRLIARKEFGLSFPSETKARQ